MTASLESPWRSRSAGTQLVPAQRRPPDPSHPITVRSRLHSRHAPGWRITLDALAAAAAATPHATARLVLVYPLVWVVLVGATRGYESRLVLPGREDVRRLFRAGVGIAVTGAALGSTISAPSPVPPATWLVLAATTVALSVAHRGAARVIGRRRTQTRVRVVVAGRAKDVRRFVSELHRPSQRHLEVVGMCVPKGRARDGEVPLTVGLDNLPRAVQQQDAQAVIVLPCQSFTPWALRRLGWSLADAGVELFLAPGLLDVDGQRTTMLSSGPVAMVHVRAPELSGARRVIVDLASRLSAALLVLLLVPLFAAIAVLVRTDSAGPALYRQVRIGRRGEPFVMWKFRTMRLGADTQLPELLTLNETDGPLFKIREDPRITTVGRWLRRYSLDELPQLLNVVRGDMTLVGPRPALPNEVQQYDDDVRRRLAVKPGITGLWQVSGRSDLSWQEGTRLDLRYVDNWSMLLDLRILVRTMRAVVRPDGAY